MSRPARAQGNYGGSYARRSYAWIAIGAFLCAALLPVMSRGLAAWSGSSDLWNEICTVAGLKTAGAESKDGMPGPPADSRPSAQDCAYCLPSQGQAPVPSQPLTLPPAAAKDTARFLLFFLGAAPASPGWEAPQSRAPPVLA